MTSRTPGPEAETAALSTEALLRLAVGAELAQARQIFDEVVSRHLVLADQVARRYHSPREDHDDLVQIARIALLEACARFDPDRGDFKHFAAATMHGLIKRHLRDHGWSVRPPRATQELALALRSSWPDLAQELRAVPTEIQMAAALGVTRDELRQAQLATRGLRAESIHAEGFREPHAGADGADGADTAVDARLVLRRALHTLDPDERRLLRMRFVEERTQSDIAADLGVSQMQVSRLLRRLLERLRGTVGPLTTTTAA